MSTQESDTLTNIHKVATKEFLEKGFRGASLRNIVKEAGVTTGAFYGYYKSKEELFDALVGKQAKHMMDMYNVAQDTFTEIPKAEQPNHMGEIGGNCMEEMLKYAYDNLYAFRLILNSAEGTEYENFVHKMVEREIESTHDFMCVLNDLGYKTKNLNPYFEHVVVSGMFSGFFELIIHEIPKDEAIMCVKEMHKFYTAGWSKIMEL